MQPAGRQGVVAARSAGRGFSFLASPVVWLMVLGVLAGGSLAATVPLSLLSHQVGDGVVALVIGVPCAGVGLVVARRQPANPLGWLFLVIAVCFFLSTAGGDYAIVDYRLGHHLPLGAVGLALDPDAGRRGGDRGAGRRVRRLGAAGHPRARRHHPGVGSRRHMSERG